MPFNARLAPTRYVPVEDRYEAMPYRRCGRSGLKLPAISLGLWQNFGDDRPLERSRAILRRAFDLGITHFDLANNYGPPYGSAEKNFGRILAEDFGGLRDELVISTKAGYDMWPGPYGEWGSRKYLLASLEQSLERMGLDHVDIFYSHRFDPDTPLSETMGALDEARRRGLTRYVGISSHGPERTTEAAEMLRELGTPLLIHQPSYSLINRWIEEGLLDVLGREGVGAIVFSPLAQGLLTDRYLKGVPEDSRLRAGNYMQEQMISDENLARVRALDEIATRARPVARADGDRVGAARRARDIRAARREQRRAARAERRRAPAAWTSPPRNWSRSTATPPRATSTSGRPPARASPAAASGRAAPDRTERAGFEPAMEFDPHTRLAGECLQPLGHLSRGELPSVEAAPAPGEAATGTA